MMKETTKKIYELRLYGVGIATLLLAPLTAHAAEDLEWEPGEGYHREEWYDPSDWFNDDGKVDYKYDYDGYSYYDGYWDGYTWYDDYDYTNDYDLGPEYVWNAVENEWQLRYDDGTSEELYSAKYQFDDSDGSQSAKQSNSSKAERNQSNETVKGTVKAFRKIEVTSSNGYEETHALARVSLDNGQDAVIDLGTAALLTADISSGDKVTFQGSSGKIGDRNVFVASKMMVGGDSVFIDRTLPASGNESRTSGMSKNSQREQGEQLVLEGKIAEKEVVELSGENEPQTVVKIDLQNGKSASVKLGSETSLADLDLQKGDRISIRGHREQISGENIVVVQTIRVEGKKVQG